MNITIKYVALFSMLFVLWSCGDQEEVVTNQSEELSSSDSEAAGQYIVVFKEDAITAARVNEPVFTVRSEKAAYSEGVRIESEAKMQAFFEEVQIDADHVSAMYTAVFTGFAAELTEEELVRIKNDPRVDLVEPNVVLKQDHEVLEVLDESDLNLYNERTLAQRTSCAVENAGGFVNSSSKESRIWIIDSGIDLDHPDLNVDTYLSTSFTGGSANDVRGHGTHVAGIAAAKNNNRGVVGTSAGAKLVAVKVVSNNGGLSKSRLISGMDYVAQNDSKGDVVNISLGLFAIVDDCSSSTLVGRALTRLSKQSAVVLAAGNEMDDASNYEPGCHNMERVYTVGNMRCSGTEMYSDSNYGDAIDYVASGENILSTYINGGYARLSGTSMAAPVVAGIIHGKGGFNKVPRTEKSLEDAPLYSYPIATK